MEQMHHGKSRGRFFGNLEGRRVKVPTSKRREWEAKGAKCEKSGKGGKWKGPGGSCSKVLKGIHAPKF